MEGGDEYYDDDADDFGMAGEEAKEKGPEYPSLWFMNLNWRAVFFFFFSSFSFSFSYP